MSHFLDRLTFFKQKREPFSNGHGVLTEEDRKWENGYRSRWAHDKIARSTHGVNCTGSCSWKIYVKKRHYHMGNPTNGLPTHTP